MCSCWFGDWALHVCFDAAQLEASANDLMAGCLKTVICDVSSCNNENHQRIVNGLGIGSLVAALPKHVCYSDDFFASLIVRFHQFSFVKNYIACFAHGGGSCWRLLPVQSLSWTTATWLQHGSHGLASEEQVSGAIRSAERGLLRSPEVMKTWSSSATPWSVCLASHCACLKMTSAICIWKLGCLWSAVLGQVGTSHQIVVDPTLGKLHGLGGAWDRHVLSWWDKAIGCIRLLSDAADVPRMRGECFRILCCWPQSLPSSRRLRFCCWTFWLHNWIATGPVPSGFCATVFSWFVICQGVLGWASAGFWLSAEIETQVPTSTSTRICSDTQSSKDLLSTFPGCCRTYWTRICISSCILILWNITDNMQPK